MTSHRFLLLASAPFAVVGGLVVGACSSSSSTSNGNPTNLPAGCPSDPFSVTDAAAFDPTKITRDEACARYVKALNDRATALTCSFGDNAPTCPKVLEDFEATLHGTCVGGYAAGSIANCECRIASYTSCGDFQTKPCLIAVIPDPTGAACASDGGADGSTDGSGDAFPETSAFDDADAGGGG